MILQYKIKRVLLFVCLGLEYQTSNPGRALLKIITFRKDNGCAKYTNRHTYKDVMREKRKQKISKTTLTSCFFIYCGWPLSFYLGFMYFNPILKETYGYSAEDIIFHNFFLSIVMLVNSAIWSLLSYRIHPLKILKRKAEIFFGLTLLLPLLISKTSK